MLKGEVFPGAHAPLIDEATWDAVQRVREGRARKRTHGGRVSVDAIQRDGALLIDLARCGVCGARMWYQPRQESRNRFYRCATRATGGDCSARMVPVAAVAQHFVQTLQHLAMTPELLAETVRELQPMVAAVAPRVSQRSELAAKIKRLGRLYVDGLKTDADYDTELTALRQQLARLSLTEAPLVNDADAAKLLGDLPLLLRAATPIELRAVIIQLVDEVHIKGRIAVAIRPTSLYGPLHVPRL